MPRTSTIAVTALLGANYGPLPDGTLPDLTQYVAYANAITDRVASMAATRSKALTAAELELVERAMAAHYYTKMDPLYASRSTGGASGSFVNDPEVPERYLKMARDIDVSGSVNALSKRLSAGASWLGKPASEQLSFDQRN